VYRLHHLSKASLFVAGPVREIPTFISERSERELNACNLSVPALAKTVKRGPTHENAQPGEDKALPNALAIYESANLEFTERTASNSTALCLACSDSWVPRGDTVEDDAYRAVRGGRLCNCISCLRNDIVTAINYSLAKGPLGWRLMHMRQCCPWVGPTVLDHRRYPNISTASSSIGMIFTGLPK
jgi:hypothetical protein